jgi:hypothetical protein
MAAALLAGCGSQMPIGTPGTVPQSRAITVVGVPAAAVAARRSLSLEPPTLKM